MCDLLRGTGAWLGSLLAVCLPLAVIRGASRPPNPPLHMEHIYLQKIASLMESLPAAAVLWLPVPLDTSGNSSSQRDSSMGHGPGAAFPLSGLQRGSQLLQSVKHPAQLYLTARTENSEHMHRIISGTPLPSTLWDPSPETAPSTDPERRKLPRVGSLLQ